MPYVNRDIATILGIASMNGGLRGFSGREALGQEKRERSPELVAELKTSAEAKRARKAAKRLAEKGRP